MIILTPADIPQPIRVAWWVATALAVIVVVNSVAVILIDETITIIYRATVRRDGQRAT